MPINPDYPVVVHRTIVTPAGNVYDARKRPYPAGEIPAEFLTDTYCTQQGIVLQPIPSTSVVDRVLTETTIKELKPEIGKLEIHNPTPNGEGETSVVKVQINEAPIEQIQAIDGIGEAIAKKVVAKREEAPFTSVEDLNERIKLGFGKNWEQFAEQIAF